MAVRERGMRLFCAFQHFDSIVCLCSSGVVGAAICVASLALIDAGVECFDMVPCCTVVSAKDGTLM